MNERASIVVVRDARFQGSSGLDAWSRAVRRAAAQVGAATVIAGILGYLAQFFAARWLGPSEYADFAVFWAVLYTILFTLGGTSLDMTRVARIEKLRLDDGDASAGSGPRFILVMAAISLVASVVILASGLLWAPAVLGAEWWPKLLLLAMAAVLVFPGLATGALLAGMARWRVFAPFSLVEATARFVLLFVVALWSPNLMAFCVATILAFLPAPILIASVRRLREPVATLRSDVPTGATVTRMLGAMFASGLSGVLLNGTAAILVTAAAVFPRGATQAELGVLVLLVTLTRAPLLVPITAFQMALIARFTGLDAAARQRWIPMGIGILAIATTVLAGLAALVGPPLLPLIFGADFQAGPGIFAALVGASFGLAVITLTGMLMLSAARHTVYLVGWIVAIAVTVGLLWLLPIEFEWATVIALAIGPLIGALVHLLSLGRPGRITP